jgi:hypothetical protein
MAHHVGQRLLCHPKAGCLNGRVDSFQGWIREKLDAKAGLAGFAGRGTSAMPAVAPSRRLIGVLHDLRGREETCIKPCVIPGLPESSCYQHVQCPN